MGVLTEGIQRVRDLIKADVDTLQLGTDSTIFNASQTGILAGVGATDLSVTKTDTTQGFKIVYSLPVGTGNRNSYTEYVVKSTDGTTEFVRGVFAPVDKTTNVTIEITDHWIFEKNNE